MIVGVRSFIMALRAGRRDDRAQSLVRSGRSAEALGLAREGLSLLRSDRVSRTSPGAMAVLVMLTIVVEQLASQLAQPGASEEDLRDVLAILERSPSGRTGKMAKANAEWIDLLRARLKNP